jgi:hypothetical protein
MGSETRRILRTALAIVGSDMPEIAVGLPARLDGPADPDAEEAWMTESTRRAASVLRGEATLIDWEDAEAEAEWVTEE